MGKNNYRVASLLVLVLVPLFLGAGSEAPYVLREVGSFGGIEADLFFFVTDIEIDERGFLYVTDSLDCSLMKIDSSGRLVAKTGRKGQGPGEFQKPVLVRVFKNKVYVADQNRLGVSVFDSNLKYLYSIDVSYPIFDLQIQSENEIYINSLMVDAIQPFLVVDSMGKILSGSLKKNSASGEIWKSSGKIVLDADGHTYFVAAFEDRLVKFDKSHKVIWSRALGQNGDARKKTLDSPAGKVVIPTEILYKDIDIGRDGLLYILKGKRLDADKREIIVVDADGDILHTVILPFRSHVLTFDKENYVYSTADEGITIKKYKLEKNGR